MRFFDLNRRLRIALGSLEEWQKHAEKSREHATFCQAELFKSWTVIRAQQKGLNRQRRLIKRLQTGDARAVSIDKRICKLQDELQSYADMLNRLQLNRPALVPCPKCGRMLPECVGDVPCYYQAPR